MLTCIFAPDLSCNSLILLPPRPVKQQINVVMTAHTKNIEVLKRMKLTWTTRKGSKGLI